MERETTRIEKETGVFYENETIRTTPEDGIVSDRKTRPVSAATETRGNAHMGYQNTRVFSTNDPRITRLFIHIFCAIFSLIALITLILGKWFFSILFAAAAGLIFTKSNKRIDQIAQDLSEKGQDVTIDSPEELKEVMTGVTDEMKDNFLQSAQETFTHNNLRHFTKVTLPIFCVLGIVVSLGLGLAVSKVLGLFVLFLFVILGVLYYFVLLKIIEKIFSSKK